MKMAAVVIVYHPDSSFFNNLATYESVADKVYVIDNTEESGLPPDTGIFLKPHVVYLRDGKNEGIARRLNQACKLAIEEKYDWLLTMDQDSYFDSSDLQQYIQCINTYQHSNSIAMFGIKYGQRPVHTQACNSEEVTILITSGSILNLALYPAIGGFDEALFIDEVDTDYCYHSIQKGFSIVQFQNIYLNHSLGKVSYHRSLKGFKLTPRELHSAFRLYYMVRNFLYLKEKYQGLFQENVAVRKRVLLHRIKNSIFYKKDRGRVVFYILKGITDFRRKKMGKLAS